MGASVGAVGLVGSVWVSIQMRIYEYVVGGSRRGVERERKIGREGEKGWLTREMKIVKKGREGEKMWVSREMRMAKIRGEGKDG